MDIVTYEDARIVNEELLSSKPSIRLNRQKLIPKQGKDYAEIVMIGDIHLGHPQSRVDKAKEMIDYCIDKNLYMMCMGDMIEVGLTTSVGNTVYHQLLNPHQQIEKVIELLKPAADKKLILGFHQGNHEMRVDKSAGIDVAKMMAKDLKVPYLGYAAWNIFYIGKQSYTLYTYHGSSGSKHVHTKLKAAIDLSNFFWSDVFAMGHVHDVDSTVLERQYIDKVTKAVKTKKQYVVLTGHYLGYDKSYAQQHGYPPSKLGSPKILLNSVTHDVHVTT